MPWIIDKDRLGGDYPAAAGLTGPCNYKGDGSELTKRFRLLDDDREVYYEGRSGDDSDFGPLDNFGEPNAGCTIIQYWVAGTGGGWRDL